jgi:hypothetical protein
VLGEHGEQAIDCGERARVAQRLVDGDAVADVGKQDGALGAGFGDF